MSVNEHFEEEDLALYAMGLLAEPEASAVASGVAEDQQLRRRLAEVQAKLAAYGEASVELLPVPAGSLDRLLNGIETERKTSTSVRPLAGPVLAERKSRIPVWRGAVSWSGWAVAAMLALSAGKLYHDRLVFQQSLATSESAMAVEQRSLQAQLSAQVTETERLQAEASRAQSAAAGLKKTVAGEEQTLTATVQTAAAAQHERDLLRGTVQAQAGQVAQLASAQANAESILAALRDPAALRVSLKTPKAKLVPEGRATYLASSGALVFLASNLAPLRVNKVYELWLMPADGSNPIPAGTFAPDTEGNASLIYSRFARAVSAKGFSVTIENAGGSQTPTLPILLAGL